MSVKYSAIAAKLRAMHSSFLTGGDYERLLSKKSVNEICAYLKSAPGYCDALADVNERGVHRGEMERMLERDIMDEYVRIYNFVDFSDREIMNLWFMRRELRFLKREIRHIYTHEKCVGDDIDRGTFNDFFDSHTKIDKDIMQSASSLSDCIKACEKTPYAEPLRRAESLEVDFFSAGMVLESFYYRYIWKTGQRRLNKEQLGLFRKLMGSQIDMLNLMWIYRGKKYFSFENEMIFTYLLPVQYRLKENTVKRLVMTSDTESFTELVKSSTPYGELFDNYDNGIFPEENYNRIYRRLSENIFVSYTETIVAVCAYLNLKEEEIKNITTIIEGVRYGLNPDFIREHIGMQ